MNFSNEEDLPSRYSLDRAVDKRYDVNLRWYTLAFEMLKKEVGTDPKRMLFGFSGKGPEIEAASIIWDKADYTSVTLGDSPHPRLLPLVGTRLKVIEQDVESFLRGTEQLFDLALFSNTISPAILNPKLPSLIYPVIQPGGYVFHYRGGGQEIDVREMDKLFCKIELPHALTASDVYLWKKK